MIACCRLSPGGGGGGGGGRGGALAADTKPARTVSCVAIAGSACIFGEGAAPRRFLAGSAIGVAANCLRLSLSSLLRSATATASTSAPPTPMLPPCAGASFASLHAPESTSTASPLRNTSPLSPTPPASPCDLLVERSLNASMHTRSPSSERSFTGDRLSFRAPLRRRHSSPPRGPLSCPSPESRAWCSQPTPSGFPSRRGLDLLTPLSSAVWQRPAGGSRSSCCSKSRSSRGVSLMRLQTGILLSLFVRLVTLFTSADAGIFLQLPVLGEVSELRPEGVFSSGTATCSENGVNREVSLRVDEGVLRGLHDAKPVVPAGTH